MGIETEFKKVKLFVGFIYGQQEICEEVKRTLQQSFSPIDMESVEFPFEKTTYYNDEMGSSLFKRFFSFTSLIAPEELPDIKILTNRIEIETAINGKRIINIDPGFLSDANVILATTKNHYHRVPLAKGIYAHIEYVIKKRNTLTVMEWTYPDFRTPEYMDFFIRLIPKYKEDSRKLRGEHGTPA